MSRFIGLLVLCAAIALAGAPAGSATTVCVVGTTNTSDCDNAATGPGGALTLTSSNTALALSGGGSLTCTTTSFAGTAPAETNTDTVAIPVALRASGCALIGFSSTVTAATACNPGGAAPIAFNVTAPLTGSPYSTITVPTGCTITASVPAIGCTVLITGPQTIGNATPGTGGQTWVNGSGAAFSKDHINSDTLSATSNGTGFGCPSAGVHTGTLTGTYSVATPATAPGAQVKLITRWHSANTSLPFDATSTTAFGAVRFVSMPSNTVIDCSAGTLSGHMDADASGPAGSSPWFNALLSMGPVFTGCALDDDPIDFSCTGGMTWSTEDQGLAYNSGTATSRTGAAGKGTNGKFSGFDCSFKLTRTGEAPTGCGDFDGIARGSYINPDGAAKAIINLITTDQTLEKTAVGCGDTLPATDTTMAVGAPGDGPTDLNNLAFTLQLPTPVATQPILWYGKP